MTKNAPQNRYSKNVLRLIARVSGRVIGLAALALAGVIIISLSLVAERSVFVDAYTGTALIEKTVAQHKGFLLPAAVLETPTEFVDLAPGAEVFVGTGTTLRINRPRMNRLLEIEILDVAPNTAGQHNQPYVLTTDAIPLLAGSKIAVSSKDAMDMAPLEFEGAVSLGGFASQENPDYLQNGSFVFNERFVFSSKTRGGVETRHGQLRTASNVSITDRKGEPIVAQILIEVNQPLTTAETSVPLLRVLSVAGGRDQLPVLQVARRSFENKVQLHPRWTDRVLNNPWILGVTSALALILVILELGLLIIRSFSASTDG